MKYIILIIVTGVLIYTCNKLINSFGLAKYEQGYSQALVDVNKDLNENNNSESDRLKNIQNKVYNEDHNYVITKLRDLGIMRDDKDR